MNGKLAWLLAACALALGGCVAQAADDGERVGVGRSVQAVDGTDTSGDTDATGDDDVADQSPDEVVDSPFGTDPDGPFGDDPDGCEPEPNPWMPPFPGGMAGSGPQPGQSKH